MYSKVSASELKVLGRAAYTAHPKPVTSKGPYIMENGSESGSSSPWKSLHIPPFKDHILPASTSAYFEIAHHISTGNSEKIATKNVVKAIEDLSHLICKYHSLLIKVGTSLDGQLLRSELAQMQQSACDIVASSQAQLSSTFKKSDELPRKDIHNLEKSCRILVACVHLLDRELRRTLHLYRLFPLVPDPDGGTECFLMNIGLSDMPVSKNDTPTHFINMDPAERYLRERDAWQGLEKSILEVHNLDVDLHRDETLGPVLDYLTLCPMGLDNISSSSASITDAFVNDNEISNKKSNLVCYIIAIMAIVCVGGGVLLGVIFMIVY